MSAEGTRPLETGFMRDFTETLSYGRYLHLDELLFVIQHQTSELWLELALHELTTACDDLARAGRRSCAMPSS